MDIAHKEREAAAALPTGSVLAILYQQHAQIRELFAQVTDSQGTERQAAFDRLRELLAAHEAGEEMVVRPVTKKIAGQQVAEARNEEESEAAEVLAALEKLDVDGAEFTEKLAAFESDVSDRALHEENEEFPQLLAQVSMDDQEKMGARILKAQKAAPTHPHPGAAGSTAAQYVLGPFAALLDKAKDAYAEHTGD